ncbi:uncharacterized protein LOC114304166 [Camellia sinensis]|uniref:uncharacterized protein LOC114304166 n=1 Tax=Camellia sinensis TaxID=4442 RepID=UPI0010369CF8|nr:uncharacterized protein LOC114304166 [Camellia sinensis]
MENTMENDASESFEARMSRIQQMLTALIESLRQQPLPPPPPPVLVEPDNNNIINLTQKFMKMKPSTFSGGIEPLKAETWLLEIEKLFEVFPCSETQKVLLATYALKDEARRWWLLIQNNNGIMSWAQFNEIFYDKYFPQCFQDRKKAQKFEEGLDLDVFDLVGVLKLPAYVEVLDRALIVEATLPAEKQSKALTTEWGEKRSGFSFKKGRSFAISKKQNTGSTSSSSQSSGFVSICAQCGRRHSRVCIGYLVLASGVARRAT